MRLAFLIPSKNRHHTLRRWLPGVARAASACAARVLVCDQSPEPFPSPPAGVEVLHRPALSGLPAARNHLLEAAAGCDVVCFLDDDTQIAADFATELLALASSQPATAGWGPVVELRRRPLRRLFRCAQLGALADERRRLGRRQAGATGALFGCAMAFRTAAIGDLHFDERLHGYALGEDLDFCRRLGGRLGVARPFRFDARLRAIHHADGAGRADPWRRGRDKAELLVRLARRFGGGNPATLPHLLTALAAAAGGRGREPGSAAGVLAGLRAWLW